MSLTLARMRWLVKQGSGLVDDPAFIDEDIDEFLNLALWELEQKFDFSLKDTIHAIALVTGTQGYSISGATLSVVVDSIRSVAIVDSNSEYKKLARMTRSFLMQATITTLGSFP